MQSLSLLPESHKTWASPVLDLSLFAVGPPVCWWWFIPSVVSNSCNPMYCSPPGSSVHGTLQARILEWVAMPSSRGSSQPRDLTHVSCLLHQQAGSLPLVPPWKSHICVCVYILAFQLKKPKTIYYNKLLRFLF